MHNQTIFLVLEASGYIILGLYGLKKKMKTFLVGFVVFEFGLTRRMAHGMNSKHISNTFNVN